MSNRLIHSTSPYLLQHAHNPVDWYEWNAESLTRARDENKPILVSIGYSACHWCHVMERECFENKEIAEIMNRHFVCIKVDREERPDVDQVYMDAVQAMQIQGGWPLNVFLTPDQKPFYGGTYFPPPHWKNVLTQIATAFTNRKDEINRSAAEVTNYLNRSDLDRFSSAEGKIGFDSDSYQNILAALTGRFDNEFGGMEGAPKFVMPSVWLMLLRLHHRSRDPRFLELVNKTARQTVRAGLYDIVGGGFARYSVDAQWFAPHFEKMLYDNAQLLSLYSELYSITGDELYREVVVETAGWIAREMTHPDGGIYSALDADSEGVEGKYYTWTYEEARDVLGADFDEAAAYFGIETSGNWEHGRNILMREVNIDWRNDRAVLDKAETWKTKLFSRRSERIRPGLDDKILCAWNAMTVYGLVDAYRYLGDDRFLSMATRCIEFIETRMVSDGKVVRSWRNKPSPTEGFLEDYAFMIRAYIALYQVTMKEEWIQKARKMCAYVVDAFFDPSDGYFFYTSAEAEELIARKKEVFDNVIPSGNSIMALNLYTLSIFFGVDTWEQMAVNMVRRLTPVIRQEPTHFSQWAIAWHAMGHGFTELAIVGKEAAGAVNQFSRQYFPLVLIQGTEDSSNLPLFEGKKAIDGKTTMYVCQNRTCKQPVHTVTEVAKQIYSAY